jgi:hypothetical protein
MKMRSSLLAAATLFLVQIATASAQSVYVAPEGIYIATPRVYLTPGPGNGDLPYPACGPSYEVPIYLPRSSNYGSPALDYGPSPRLYSVPGYEEQQSEYAEERPLRPPADVPYSPGRRRCPIWLGARPLDILRLSYPRAFI